MRRQKELLLSFKDIVHRIDEEKTESITLPDNKRFIKDLEQRNIPELWKISKGMKQSKSGASLQFTEDMISKLLKNKTLEPWETVAELYLKYRGAFDINVFLVVYRRLHDACETARLDMMAHGQN